MKKNGGKKSVVTILAILAAIVGAAVAVYTFLKKKANDIGKQLDYDGSIYYEDEDMDDEFSSEDDADALIPDAAYADEVSIDDEPDEPIDVLDKE